MRLLITSDWHLTDKQPKNRLDNYPETQYNKIKYLLDTANREKVDCVLDGGDTFDSFKVSNYLLQKYISLFKEYDIPILCVYGQHDQKYHSSDTQDTPLAVLQSAGVIKILKNDVHRLNKHDDIYGCSWGQDIPKTINSDAFNILVIHKMIIKNEKLWKAQEDYTTTLALFKETDYDLIISGDNHRSFTAQDKERVIFNCGSIMRSDIDQVDHKPLFYIFNTETKKFSTHFIPLEKNVFDKEEISIEKERNKELESFVKELENDKTITGLNYKKNMISYCEENKIKKDVEQIVNYTMENA